MDTSLSALLITSHTLLISFLFQVSFDSMESKVVRGLYLAGEVLDIDGVTGGYNFQSAWTAGWLAGHSAATDLLHAEKVV